MSQLKFQIGEKVLCQHGPMIYEAHVIQSISNEDLQPRYFIHYKGWNHRFDEWRDEAGLLEINETNLKRQQACILAEKERKQLLRQQEAIKKTKSKNKTKRHPKATKPENVKILTTNGATGKKKRKSVSLDNVDREGYSTFMMSMKSTETESSELTLKSENSMSSQSSASAKVTPPPSGSIRKKDLQISSMIYTDRTSTPFSWKAQPLEDWRKINQDLPTTADTQFETNFSDISTVSPGGDKERTPNSKSPTSYARNVYEKPSTAGLVLEKAPPAAAAAVAPPVAAENKNYKFTKNYNVRIDSERPSTSAAAKHYNDRIHDVTSATNKISNVRIDNERPSTSTATNNYYVRIDDEKPSTSAWTKNFNVRIDDEKPSTSAAIKNSNVRIDDEKPSTSAAIKNSNVRIDDEKPSTSTATKNYYVRIDDGKPSTSAATKNSNVRIDNEKLSTSTATKNYYVRIDDEKPSTSAAARKRLACAAVQGKNEKTSYSGRVIRPKQKSSMPKEKKNAVKRVAVNTSGKEEKQRALCDWKKLVFPQELRNKIWDDYYATNRLLVILTIPAEVTVEQICNEYLEYKKANGTPDNTMKYITGVITGIVEYFDVVLGSQLLFARERPKYVDMYRAHPDTMMSKLYSGFHLLRGLVKLNELFEMSQLGDEEMRKMLDQLHDFINFLAERSSEYFKMSHFENITPEYFRRTRNL